MDFKSQVHPIHARYGLKRFVLCQPVISKYSTKVSSSEAKLLLSCLTVAMQHLDCKLPVFAQDGDFKNSTYLGHFTAPPCQVDFTAVALPRPPRAYQHVSGLVTLFKSKLPEVDAALKAIISARFTFTLRNWFSAWRPNQDSRLLYPTQGKSRYEGQLKLVVGSLSDSITALKLMTTWPRFKEQTLVDNEVYSDLSPMTAPEWLLSFDEDHQRPMGHLERLLNHMLAQHARSDTYKDMIGEEAFQDPDEEGSKDGKAALAALTTKMPRAGLGDDLVENVRRVGRVGRQLRTQLGNVMERTVERTVQTVTQRHGESGVTDADLDAVLSALFVKPTVEDSPTEPTVNFGAPLTSLTHRLAQYLACLDQYSGGARGVAVFWAELVLELRWHWENLKPMPLGDVSTPNLRATLLHQKLQFLNYCIERQSAVNRQRSGSHRDSATDDDEFYLCPEDEEGARLRLEQMKLEAAEAAENGASLESSTSDTDPEPIGIRKVHDTLTLLDGRPLNVPITQEPGPMTDDMLKEKEAELMEMGDSDAAAATRAHLQSLSLQSDMQAFKAANPSCQLADFVRWHSPRDWIVEEGQLPADGHLSSRFEGKDNLWLNLWQSARAVPAARQKQLFDCTREAEKTLQYIEGMTVGQVNVQLLPCLLNESICIMKALAKEHGSERFGRDVKAYTMACSTLTSEADLDQWEACIKRLGQLEHLYSKLLALRDKLEGSSPQLLEELITTQHASIHDQDLRPRLLAVFQEDGESIRPETHEYVLRTVASSPRASARPLSHRMYAQVADERFIINGAFAGETSLTI
eukprot:TRINITY_DN9384_c1_g1_i4.p1 TRINITY_DN9384_c1_g1~~TRINITY_DN9384_c1_g1_i4.p1  ORF type:complete len:931 (+),score=216.45 TRINITY_DN9384_c1_g1_i4:380-2794(+)